MNARFGLPYYVRTLDLRQRLTLRYHPACATFSASGFQAAYCPHCGRDGDMETVDLCRPGTIDQMVVVRPTQHALAPYAVGTVAIAVRGQRAVVPTAFADLPVTAAVLPVDSWQGLAVEPTLRILERNPGGAIFYGIKFRPALMSAMRQAAEPELRLEQSARAGIAAVGVAIPRDRMVSGDLAEFWGVDPKYVTKGLAVSEVTVAAADQDATTLAVDAARDALARLPEGFAKTVGMVVVGSESKPYAVKPIAATVVHAAGLPAQVIAYDAEFACIGAGMQLAPALALIEQGIIESALIIGSDVAQAAPGDALDLEVGAGAVCFVLSRYNVVLEPLAFCTAVGDHPDFARRAEQRFPFHGAAFTGAPSYFAFQRRGIEDALATAGLTVRDVAGAALHSPNGSFVRRLAADLGFLAERQADQPPCVLAEAGRWLGNTYNAATMFGLAELLHEPEHVVEDGRQRWHVRFAPGDCLLLGFYGSGAAGAGALFRLTDRFADYQSRVCPLSVYRDAPEGGPLRRRISPLQRYAAKGMLGGDPA